jgi:hypothetical protein
MRAEDCRSLQPGDWMTLTTGLYAGIEGQVLEVQVVHPLIHRARLCLPCTRSDSWQPYWNEPMTEAEWLSTQDTSAMERYLSERDPPPNSRKCRLFACACARRAWRFLPEGAWREAIEIGERFADGQAIETELKRINQSLALAWSPKLTFLFPLVALPIAALASLTMDQLGLVRRGVQRLWPTRAEADAQRELLRDIFGNPFRPALIDPHWLAWQGGFISQLARMIYEERRWEDLGILGDALEDAGCRDETMLSHCRDHGGPHARGCWLVDALLGRE